MIKPALKAESRFCRRGRAERPPSPAHPQTPELEAEPRQHDGTQPASRAGAAVPELSHPPPGTKPLQRPQAERGLPGAEEAGWVPLSEDTSSGRADRSLSGKKTAHLTGSRVVSTRAGPWNRLPLRQNPLRTEASVSGRGWLLSQKPILRQAP